MTRWQDLVGDLANEFSTREKELETLRALDRRIVDDETPQEKLYGIVVKDVMRLCSAEAAQLLIRTRGGLKIVASHPKGAYGVNLKLDECATGLCVETGRPFRTGNIWRHRIRNRYADILSAELGEKLHSALAAPMILKGQVVGVVNVESPRRGAFDHHHQSLLLSYAAQAAVAFTRLRLVDDNAFFRDIDSVVLDPEAASNIPAIVNKSLRSLDEYIGPVPHYQVLFPFADHLEIAFSSIGKDVNARVEIEGSISGRAVKERRSQVVSDVRTDNDFLEVLESETRSEMAVPVTLGDRIVAVINLESHEVGFFDEYARVMVEHFSREIRWVLAMLRVAWAFEKRQRHERASEATTAIGSQAANLMHRLKNELMPLKGRCEQLQRKHREVLEATPDLKEKVEFIRKKSEDALKIPSMLFKKFARADRVKVNGAIRRVVKQFKSSHSGVQVKLNLAGDLSAVRCRDLDGVLENLLLNAAEAMEHSGTIEITSSVAHLGKLDTHLVVVEVSDSGPGIPEASLPKVFWWDFTTKEHGMGMGLAWCRMLIESEAGRLEARNRDSGGLTVSMYLDTGEEVK